MRTNLAFAIVAAAVVCAAPASPADIARGEQLARQWCVNCHVIGPATRTTTQQGPPSLPAVAASGLAVDQLRAFLTHPHGEMPDLSLSRAEIDDLIGYIQSFR
jgi:cytochrome c